MKIFVAASYSLHVNYDTGEVFPDYKQWLEEILTTLESNGHKVFCALRADKYKVNNADPATAFSLDMNHIQRCEVLLALLDDKLSAGVQTEIGVGVALKKQVILAHLPQHELPYFNAAMLKAGVVKELILPLTETKLNAMLSNEK